MSLEQALNDNTATMKLLIAALTAAGSVTAASTGTASTDTGSTDKATTGKGTGKGKGTTKTDAPKVSVEEMQAAVNEVKEKFGTAEAKAIIETAGGVKKMADIPEAKIEAVFKAAKAKLEAADDDTGGDDDDI